MGPQSETIFSKIVRREIPAAIVFENERVLAFRDIAPQAPHHILVIPKNWLLNIAGAASEHQALLGELLLVAAEIARREGFETAGYRIVINNGDDGGQTVPHLHVHILAGRRMAWPPG